MSVHFILIIMMPDLDVFQYCSKYGKDKAMSRLMLTAKSDEEG